LQDGDKVDVLVTMMMVDLDVEFQTLFPNTTLILIGPDGAVLSARACRSITIEDGQGVCGTEELPPPIGRLEIDEDTELPFYVGPPETQRPRLVTQRLIGNATVLRVGTFPLEEERVSGEAVPAPEEGVGAPPPQGGGEEAVSGPPPPDIVTLIVTPQDALALNWAMKAGLDLVLTLRGPDDTTDIDTTSVTLQYLIDSYDIAVPSKLPYGLEPRLDAPIIPVLENDAQEATPGQ
jgi:pilus assembly protein CpaB